MRLTATKPTKVINNRSVDKFDNFLHVINNILDGQPSYKNYDFIRREFDKLEDQRHELIKDEETYTYRFETPGYSIKDIEITIDGDFLVIVGKKEEPKIATRFSRYQFSKRILLPKGFDKTNVKAFMSNGILSVVVPAPKEEKNSRVTKVSINVVP